MYATQIGNIVAGYCSLSIYTLYLSLIVVIYAYWSVHAIIILLSMQQFRSRHVCYRLNNVKIVCSGGVCVCVRENVSVNRNDILGLLESLLKMCSFYCFEWATMSVLTYMYIIALQCKNLFAIL